MNPFETPDTASPTPSAPSSTAAPATLNIDAMLANLGQQSSAASAPTAVMQVSSLDKPLAPTLSPTIPQKSLFRFPSWLKTTLSLIATVIILGIGYRFISVQYPLETAAFSKSVTQTITTIVAIVTKNQDNSFGGDGSVVTTESTTGDLVDETIETPLSDALAQAASGNMLPSSTEQLRDDALGMNDSSTGALSGLVISGTTVVQTMDQTLTHAAAGSDDERKVAVREKLLAMKDVLNQKLVDLALTNNSLHLSLVKVALKNIDLTLPLSEQAHDEATRKEVDTKIEQIELIYDRLEKL